MHTQDITTRTDLTGLLAERFAQVSAELRRSSARRLAPLGLTHAQARLLRSLGDTAGAPRMSELAAGLGVVPRSATATVEALETAGFVVRVPDPDRPPGRARGALPGGRASGRQHRVGALRSRR